MGAARAGPHADRRADLQLRSATLLIQLGRTGEAIPLLKRLGRLDPAQRYMHLFQARAALAEVLRIRPDFTLAAVPRLRTGRGWLIDNLRGAGLGD